MGRFSLDRGHALGLGATVLATLGLLPASAPAAQRISGKPEPVRSIRSSSPPKSPTSSRPVAIPLRTPDPKAYAAAKAKAARQAQRSGSYTPKLRLRTAVLPDSSAAGFSNWTGLGPVSSSPSDSNGSVSRTDYMETVNSRIAAYARSDQSLSIAPATLETLTGGTRPCDPVVMWDDQQSRWFYTVIRCDRTTTSNETYFGWSKTATPTDFTTSWCKFTALDGTTFRDYPKLGDNQTHLAIGTNDFSDTGSYLGSRLRLVTKPPLGDTSCATPNSFLFPGLGLTPVPANMFDDGPTGFIVSAASTSGSVLRSYKYAGGSGAIAPTVTNLGTTAVPAYAAPAAAPQPSSTNKLDTIDARLTNAVGGPDPSAGADPAVWTQHTVNGPGGRSQVTWYQLRYTGPASTPSLRQRGVQSSATQFYFNGAISPTTLGDEAVLHYNASGATAPEFAQVRAVSRISSDPLGTMVGEKSLFTSNHASNDVTCASRPACRWGDYAGASPDPLNNRAVWGSSQVLPSTAPPPGSIDWATRNFGLSTSSVIVDRDGSGNTTIMADPGQPNKLQIARSGSTLTISELSFPTLRLTGAGACSLSFSSQATCTPLPSSLTVDAGDGNDTITANDGVVETIDCGAGTDTARVDASDVNLGNRCETFAP